MADQDKRNPGTEADISKAQAQQQPQGQQDQEPLAEKTGQFETGQQPEQTGDQAATGQAQGAAGSPDEALQGDTATRTDVEGASLSEERAEEGGFVGSQSDADSSEDLIEEEQNFGKDGQGAPEGK